jgi:hypothetical protein
MTTETTEKPARVAIVHTPIESNKLKTHGYCPATQTLALTFKNGPGNEYQYPGVTQAQYDDFMAAESKGRHFGQHFQRAPFNKFDPLAAA